MDNRRFRCCEQVFAISEFVIWKLAARPVQPARPAGTPCGSPARPRTVSSAVGRGGGLARQCRSAFVQRRVAGLLRVPSGGPLTCGVSTWRQETCNICAWRSLRVRAWPPYVSGRVPCVSTRAVAFPAGRALRVSPRSAAAFPPECGGVSAGYREVAAGRLRSLRSRPLRGPAPKPVVGRFPGV